nr:hypothetical protein [Piscirickettsia salmonis]
MPVEFEWDYFHKAAECKTPGQYSSCFPADFMRRFLAETGLTQGCWMLDMHRGLR